MMYILVYIVFLWVINLDSFDVLFYYDYYEVDSLIQLIVVNIFKNLDRCNYLFYFDCLVSYIFFKKCIDI